MVVKCSVTIVVSSEQPRFCFFFPSRTQLMTFLNVTNLIIFFFLVVVVAEIDDDSSTRSEVLLFE